MYQVNKKEKIRNTQQREGFMTLSSMYCQVQSTVVNTKYVKDKKAEAGSVRATVV